MNPVKRMRSRHQAAKIRAETLDSLFEALAEQDVAAVERFVSAEPELLFISHRHAPWTDNDKKIYRTPLSFILDQASVGLQVVGDESLIERRVGPNHLYGHEWVAGNAAMARLLLRHIAGSAKHPERIASAIDRACGKRVASLVAMAANNLPELVPDLLTSLTVPFKEKDARSEKFVGYQKAIHYAIRGKSKAHLEALKALVATGISLDHSLPFVIGSYTPLTNACELQEETHFSRGTPHYFENIKTLLDAGANPNARDNRGRTPLYFMMQKANIPKDALHAMIDAGVNLISPFGKETDEKPLSHRDRRVNFSLFHTIGEYVLSKAEAIPPAKLASALLDEKNIPTTLALQLAGCGHIAEIFTAQTWKGHEAKGIDAACRLRDALPEPVQDQMQACDLSELVRSANEPGDEGSFAGRYQRTRTPRTR